jgi:ABC-2 type transport system permease protein
MKQFFTFVRKEFAHVFRDRKTLLMLFGLPIVQIVLFGFALTNEVKNARIAVVDYAHDNTSREITDRIQASRYFDVEKLVLSQSQIEKTFREGKVKLVIVFPPSFGAELLHQNKAQIQVLADASDPNTATTLTNYISGIIADYQSSLLTNQSSPIRISTEVKMLYNPELQGQHNFVPGVMALVLMLICVMMTSISIVREKELGTMEILLVSPFRPLLVIISKAVPYFILSLVNLSVILILSVYLLDLPVKGSVVLLVAISMLFIITALSLGLLISTRAQSQQTAMMMSMMGMLLPTMLFTGFMFPIENMPVALQVISNAIPARWYYIIVKAIMIKGQGFASIWKETLILLGMTLFFLAVSFRNFKTRLA